jgi:hypothetical protein
MTTTDSSNHRNVPILTRANFPKWEVQVLSCLTGTADHVRVIERRRDSTDAYVDPVRPVLREKWDASEREAHGVIMCTASDLHLEIIMQHRDKAGKSVYDLWKKIRSLHRSTDASLRHEAWLEFLAIRRSPAETYTELSSRIESAYVKVERITPDGQTAVQRGEELCLFAFLSALPFGDHMYAPHGIGPLPP